MTSTRNQSVLSRTLNQISSSTSISPSVSSPTVNDTAHLSSPNPFVKGKNSSNIVTVDESGFTLLSDDAIMRILNIHAEAVIRCVELEDAQELQVFPTHYIESLKFNFFKLIKLG